MIVTKLLRKKNSLDGTRCDTGESTARQITPALSFVRTRFGNNAYVFMSPSSEAEFIKIFRGPEKKQLGMCRTARTRVSNFAQRRAELRERLSVVQIACS